MHGTAQISPIVVCSLERIMVEVACADPKSLVRDGPIQTTFYSWCDENGSKYHSKRAIISPAVKQHWKGVSLSEGMMAQHWMLALFCRESGPGMPGNLIFLWFFGGGGGRGPDPLSPSRSAHELFHAKVQYYGKSLLLLVYCTSNGTQFFVFKILHEGFFTLWIVCAKVQQNPKKI